MDLQEVLNILKFSEVEHSTFPESHYIIVQGVFRNVGNPESLVSTSIQFKLFFDSQQKYLIKKEEKKFYTGM